MRWWGLVRALVLLALIVVGHDLLEVVVQGGRPPDSDSHLDCSMTVNGVELWFEATGTTEGFECVNPFARTP